jgi:hypothetical protein
VERAPTVPSDFDPLQLYDGPSGVSSIFWNAAIGAAWDNVGGDWRDAAFVPQGDTPLGAAQTITATGWKQFAVTALAVRWLRSGNTGMLVRTSNVSGAGEVSIAARQTANASYLTVVADGVTYNCPCTADSRVSITTREFSQGDLDICRVSSTVNSVFQFDLSAIPTGATVSSATWNAHCTLAGIPISLMVMELNPPPIWIAKEQRPDGAVTHFVGLSSAYPYDGGLHGEPGVLLAGDFSGSWYSKWTRIGTSSVGASATDIVAVPDNTGKTPGAHQGYQAPPAYTSESSYGGQVSLERFYVSDVDQPLPYGSDYRSLGQMIHQNIVHGQADAETMHFRVVMEAIGRRDPNQGEKFGPSIDGRGGFKSGGRWVGVHGNGRNATRGVFLPNTAKIVGNPTAGATTITIGGLPANVPCMFPDEGGGRGSVTIRGVEYTFAAGDKTTWYTDGNGQKTLTSLSPAVPLGGFTNGEAVQTFTTVTDASTLALMPVDPENGTLGYLSGWSLRLMTEPPWNLGDVDIDVPENDPNPYREYMPLALYFYNPEHDWDALSTGGDIPTTQFFPDLTLQRRYQVGSRESGYPLLKTGQKYNAEIGVTLNSLTGAADQWGNRTAVKDGVIGVWVDGVQVKELTDCVFRRHPNIKANGPWIDFYVGGTASPIVPFPMSRKIYSYAAATSYIGPQVELPAWRAALGEYTLTNVSPQGDTLVAKYMTHPTFPTWATSPPPESIPLAGAFQVRDSMQGWTGGVFSEYMGKWGGFLTANNGHAGPHGTIVYHWDAATGLWQFPVVGPGFDVATPGYVPTPDVGAFYDPNNYAGYPQIDAGLIGSTNGPFNMIGAGVQNGGGWSFPTWNTSLQYSKIPYAEYKLNVGMGARYDIYFVIPPDAGGETDGTLGFFVAAAMHTFPGEIDPYVHRVGLTSKAWVARSANSIRGMAGPVLAANPLTGYSKRYRKAYRFEDGREDCLVYDSLANRISFRAVKENDGINSATAIQAYIGKPGSAVVTDGLASNLLVMPGVLRNGDGYRGFCLIVVDLDELERNGSARFYAIGTSAANLPAGNPFALKLLGNYTLGAYTGPSTGSFSFGWSAARKSVVLIQTMRGPSGWIAPTNPYSGTPVQPSSDLVQTIRVPDGFTNGVPNWRLQTWTVTPHPLTLGPSTSGLAVGSPVGRDGDNPGQLFKRLTWAEKLDCGLVLPGADTPIQAIALEKRP